MVNVKNIYSIRCAILSEDKKVKTRYIEFFLGADRPGKFQKLSEIPSYRSGVLKPTKDILYEVRGLLNWQAVTKDTFKQYLAAFDDIRALHDWDPVEEIVGVI